MSTYIDVHKPEPPDQARITHGTDDVWVSFMLDGVQVYIHDPQWFDRVAEWATGQAVRLRAAQAGVQPCETCGEAGQLAVAPDGARLCFGCYSDVVDGPKDAA